ncbi:MAG: ABC transporter permease [Turicibacter sp.]|nr:ABC transporter permease [Turicibacter sp.]
MAHKLKYFAFGLLLIHALWLYGTLAINGRLIPAPWVVYGRMDIAFWSMMGNHIWHSAWRLLAGLFISMALGLFLGLLMAQSNWLSKTLNPFMYFLYPIPKMAFLPVVMLLLGLGNPTTIAMIVLIIVFQVMVNVRDGIVSIPPEHYQILKVLGANPWQLLKEVTFPAALSVILSSTRVALGTATAILFITETQGTRYGLGFYIMDAFHRINYVDMYAGITVLSIVAFGLFLLVDLADRLLLKWNKVSGS